MNIAEKITRAKTDYDEVYKAGKQEGKLEGKQSEYDRFWDAFQDNGTRTNYNYAFAARSWNLETFKPKYDLICTSCTYMFGTCSVEDIEAALFNLGITLDTSQSKYMQSMLCYNYWVKVLPVISAESMETALIGTFDTATSLETIRKFVLKQDGSNTFDRTFKQCTGLKNILIEGVIGDNFDIRYSPLTRESMMGKEITADEYNALSENVQTNNVYVKDGKYYYGGVITALSPTVSGKTVYFKKTAKTVAFTDTEWSELIATKPNWTFTLV